MKEFNLRDRLFNFLPISESQLNVLIVRSPYIYKKYTIPKKSGGSREIAQPARATKFIQNLLIEILLNELPVHESVTAYRKGSSIKLNALAHAKNPYLSKFDFKDFFTSIQGSDIKAHIQRSLPHTFSSQDLDDIMRIICKKTEYRDGFNLSVGAPSSPLISNTILFEFDSLVSDWCKEKGFIYTRYADDLSFSTKVRGLTSLLEPFLIEVLTSLDYPKLELNSKKTIHLSKKHQRRVTGLILNNDGVVSLGRDKKRLISSMIHKYSLDKLGESDIPRLQGYLGLAKDVDPTFVVSMNHKYGSAIITKLFKFRKT